MTKYRKRPIVVDAFQWTGDENQTEDPLWIINEIKNGKVSFRRSNGIITAMEIETLEGVMCADFGDFIIRGIQDEIYPCKPDIFAKTYELVENDTTIEDTDVPIAVIEDAAVSMIKREWDMAQTERDDLLDAGRKILKAFEEHHIHCNYPVLASV